MQNITPIIQIILAFILIILILLQNKSGGLGATFGGISEQYRSKRGFERLLFRATIVITSLFLISSVLNLLV
jgi:protein translocase SecG subunit